MSRNTATLLPGRKDMKDNIDQEYKRLVIFNIFMIVFFGTLLAAGSFSDEQIARFLYSPDNTFVKFVTSTGVYPFFAFAVLFTGALCHYDHVQEDDTRSALPE